MAAWITRPSGDLDVGGSGLEELRGGKDDLVSHLPGGDVDRAARIDSAPRGKGADAERYGSRVSADDRDPVRRNAQSVSGDLGEGRLVPLPLAARPGGDDGVA
jgi:hypothetical protein